MGEIHIEVQVSIHDLPKDLTILKEGNKPSTYSTVMAWDQEFIVIFKRWHEHHHHREPLENFEFIFYPLGSPHPIPDGFGPGPVNNPIIVKPEDSPKSLGFSNDVPLWVKRKHCDTDDKAEANE
ncbi:uncharacterized protein I303_105111 [Kwoniella dejecticola CBS 10117]|uniref:Uncharacterized protein n=1 Tax=Kwoniella dejecticola CBS 10117 TaxID=1296121 RepID=A0A1A6A3E7_9TREE|nr:uncharacterized protein I303_05444 [Kwoniella dejecticola CBS 10117]OBR84585.1 hypothetical protein I303_05444 [Kwoniella dejecticola CBS 10117]